MPFGHIPRTDLAPLRNREPESPPTTFTNVIDESLEILAGSALDFSGDRTTAVPAGSRGRITESGGKLYENGAAVRFNIATVQFDTTYTILPADNATADAAAANLARQGFNAIRLMGIEHYIMSGMNGAAAFDPAKLDRYDYFLAACKEQGIFWIFSPISYNGFEDMAGATNRFAFTEATSVKPRLYTEQTVRDNWALGVSRLWNRINPYTGLNMLQDPALVLLELFNEQSTTFCGGAQWPSRWLSRTAGATAAAKLWGEWLADPAQSHGYADIAALNTSWGAAHADFDAAAAASMPAQTNSMAQTQQNIDGVLYCQYLEDDWATYLAAWKASVGYQGMLSQHTMYVETMEARGAQKYDTNSVGNWHAYFNIAHSMTVGDTVADRDCAVWEAERVVIASPASSGPKATWLGESGNHTYARWRHQWPIVAASMATQGASAVSWFSPSDPFTLVYSNDATTHGDRVRRLDTYSSKGAHADAFVRAVLMSVFMRGDVSALTYEQDITLNNRYGGISPRSTGRLSRTHSTLFQPLQFICALALVRLRWTDDTTDDSLAVAWNTKTLAAILSDLQAAGAISGSHATLVSVNANNGAIDSLATTGTVGGLAASVTQPVIDVGSNTLADGDSVQIPSLNGSVGTWPGINLRNSVCSVRKGAGNYIRLEADATRGVSGIDLTGLSGANFTSGTWCEAANVLEAGNGQWGMSRRLKRAFVNTTKTVFFAHTNATLPVTFGQVTVTSLTQNVSIFVRSLDGLSIETSARLLLGMCGEAINTGMTYTVDANGKQTLTATGDYPVQQLDATAVLALALTRPQEWTLYRLQANGARGSAESITSIDAAAGKVNITLRTGTVQPSCQWELVR